MNIVPLSLQEQAASGFTHVIRLKVADGDLNVVETLDAIALEAGDVVARVLIDVKTAWTGGSGETISVGMAATGVSATTLFSALSLTSAVVTINANTDVALANEFITITRGGTGTSTAGEAFIYLRLIRPPKLRNTFA